MKLTVIITFGIFLGLISCNNYPKKINKEKGVNEKFKEDSLFVTGDNYDFFTRIKLSEEDARIIKMQEKERSIYLAQKYYSEITDSNFIEFLGTEYKSTALVENYGWTVISEINIRGKKLSTSTPKRCYLLYNKEKNEAIFLDFEKFYLIKRKASDKENMIGGIEKSKGVGYFLVYSFKDSSLIKIFDSGVDIDDGAIAVPIFLNDGDCVKYDNDVLSFKNIDINNDGFLDFSFEGKIMFYCKPNEYGLGMDKRKLIREKKIKINYLFEDTLDKWLLADSLKIKQLLEVN